MLAADGERRRLALHGRLMAHARLGGPVHGDPADRGLVVETDLDLAPRAWRRVADQLRLMRTVDNIEAQAAETRRERGQPRRATRPDTKRHRLGGTDVRQAHAH